MHTSMPRACATPRCLQQGPPMPSPMPAHANELCCRGAPPPRRTPCGRAALPRPPPSCRPPPLRPCAGPLTPPSSYPCGNTSKNRAGVNVMQIQREVNNDQNVGGGMIEKINIHRGCRRSSCSQVGSVVRDAVGPSPMPSATPAEVDEHHAQLQARAAHGVAGAAAPAAAGGAAPPLGHERSLVEVGQVRRGARVGGGGSGLGEVGRAPAAAQRVRWAGAVGRL